MKITNKQWQVYKNLINGAHDSFDGEILRWGRRSFNKSAFGESSTDDYVYTELRCLIGFNTFRTWPITGHTESGELDNQNMLVMINRKYLEDLGLLTPQGYFDFNPAEDVFKHRGILYKADGDTLAAQAQDDPLHVLLILARQVIPSGTERDDQG